MARGRAKTGIMQGGGMQDSGNMQGRGRQDLGNIQGCNLSGEDER